MANLKLDLISKYQNEKMFAELELVRLAQEPNMKYKDKIELMDKELAQLVVLDAKLAKVEQYFQEPQQQQVPVAPQPQAPAPEQQKPQGKVHQGQSHGEG
jgi:hypothetical protein